MRPLKRKVIYTQPSPHVKNKEYKKHGKFESGFRFKKIKTDKHNLQTCIYKVAVKVKDKLRAAEHIFLNQIISISMKQKTKIGVLKIKPDCHQNNGINYLIL